jgi:chaperone required for assembly of F1-ATPase
MISLFQPDDPKEIVSAQNAHFLPIHRSLPSGIKNLAQNQISRLIR